MKKARLYSTETCPNCVTAKNLLTLKGYQVEYLVIGKDITKDDFFAFNPHVRGVPYVIIENEGMFEGLTALKSHIQ